LLEANDVVVLKADKSDRENPAVDQLLTELGNRAGGIPYYAVFRPGKEPIHFNGVFLSPDSFIDKIGRENLTGAAPDVTTPATGQQSGSMDDVAITPAG